MRLPYTSAPMAGAVFSDATEGAAGLLSNIYTNSSWRIHDKHRVKKHAALKWACVVGRPKHQYVAITLSNPYPPGIIREPNYLIGHTGLLFTQYRYITINSVVEITDWTVRDQRRRFMVLLCCPVCLEMKRWPSLVSVPHIVEPNSSHECPPVMR